MTTPQEEYREIPLTQGQVAIVDAADYEWLMRWKWFAVWSSQSNSYYAYRYGGREKTNYAMHRQILSLGFDNPLQADHVRPGETLDNRRSNLRIATNAQNMQNRGKLRNNTSGFKGVHRNKGRGRPWRAQIWLIGKNKSLGFFDTAKEAHDAYKRAALVNHGEFARFE